MKLLIILAVLVVLTQPRGLLCHNFLNFVLIPFNFGYNFSLWRTWWSALGHSENKT